VVAEEEDAETPAVPAGNPLNPIVVCETGRPPQQRAPACCAQFWSHYHLCHKHQAGTPFVEATQGLRLRSDGRRPSAFNLTVPLL
jgi:hypothetical protein